MTRKTAMAAKAKSTTGAASQTAKTTKATAPKEKAKSRFLQKTPLIHRTRNRQQTKMPIPSFRAFKKEMLPEKMYQ